MKKRSSGMQPLLTLCRQGRRFFLLLACAFAVNLANAAATHPVTVDSFVAGAFTQAPDAEMLWLTPALKAQAKIAAGFAPDGARLRYWKRGNRTAWVIDRIGKEAPITFGVVIEDDAVVGMQVLTYRESRGYEIQAPRWLAQFTGVRANTESSGLSKSIDNISGATLSVRASRDVARMALFLHSAATHGAAMSGATVLPRPVGGAPEPGQ